MAIELKWTNSDSVSSRKQKKSSQNTNTASTMKRNFLRPRALLMTLEVVNAFVHARQHYVFVYRVFISLGMPRFKN